MNGENSENLFLEKLEALVFSRSNDAVKLAFLGDGALERIDGLDLSALTELHRLSNGSMEMKFLDRIKLLELLAQARQGAPEAKAAAICAAADRLPPRAGEAEPDGAS